jgi:hypothetical protein
VTKVKQSVLHEKFIIGNSNFILDNYYLYKKLCGVVGKYSEKYLNYYPHLLPETTKELKRCLEFYTDPYTHAFNNRTKLSVYLMLVTLHRGKFSKTKERTFFRIKGGKCMQSENTKNVVFLLKDAFVESHMKSLIKIPGAVKKICELIQIT